MFHCGCSAGSSAQSSLFSAVEISSASNVLTVWYVEFTRAQASRSPSRLCLDSYTPSSKS